MVPIICPTGGCQQLMLEREFASQGVGGGVGTEFDHTQPWASIPPLLLALDLIGSDAQSVRWLGTSLASS